MAKTKNKDNEEPNTAPEPDRWYNLSLGPSFKDPNSSSKFCTLRYEFKPASIDKSQPGSLNKSKDNRVTVEYHNNQHGRPKVSFEGVSEEDYKETDAVLFFDGETFRLERLHRAVKRLRHVRLLDDSAPTSALAACASVTAPAETHSQGLVVGKGTNAQSFNKGIDQQMRVQVEQTRLGDSHTEAKDEKRSEHSVFPTYPMTTTSPKPKNSESDTLVDIVGDDMGYGAANDNASEKELRTGLDIDINLPHQVDTDDEIANVDISDDEADRATNAAEALRAQVNAEGRKDQTSSTSSSSGSDSSESDDGSGSESSSSDSESSEGESITSI